MKTKVELHRHFKRLPNEHFLKHSCSGYGIQNADNEDL